MELAPSGCNALIALSDLFHNENKRSGVVGQVFFFDQLSEMSQKYNSLPTGEYDDNETSGKSSQQLQYDRRKRQDDSLEALGGSVLRLGQLSLGISEEIDSQNKLLEGLDADLDTANQNVDRITQMTKALVKKSGGSKGFCILIILSVILVFLVFLCIYS